MHATTNARCIKPLRGEEVAGSFLGHQQKLISRTKTEHAMSFKKTTENVLVAINVLYSQREGKVPKPEIDRGKPYA